MPAIPLCLETIPESGLPRRLLEAAGVANSGYRRDRPEISLPAGAAEHLGVWPRLPPTAVAVQMRTASGVVSLWLVSCALRVQARAPDRAGEVVVADVLINPEGDEILLSGFLVSELGIVLVDLKRDTWRFAEDPPDRERPTEPYRTW